MDTIVYALVIHTTIIEHLVGHGGSYDNAIAQPGDPRLIVQAIPKTDMNVVGAVGS